ncbi:hydantoinase/oxoprolinase family protein [Natroniella acetigena]|uniref:hydantoinase/oxoprolinase family protein n=1 Tax=Natroniella acetigena TaxID=52004 RepID=UPI00200B33E0|nr:hydantoinase/oxoprolinase family protein [Natroniella acetigena]MCK8827270.1 hydantoinase/oxoprolinase family protein [Natroniella acetigena]
MRVILGIDTGGTYTDAVLYDSKQQQILDKNKALTTHYNLTEGIINAISGLDEDLFGEVEMVALSTTLATNAIVEGNGARVGAVLLGYDQQVIDKFEFDQEIPTEEIEIIAGKFNIKGDQVEELDEAKIREIGIELKDKVDAIAVSGYMSVRNPAHELRAKEILEEVTGLPVVCGHRLTNRLNAIKRATTVVLNASLIPLIKDLNQRVKDVLEQKEIEAPVMIVKGDGSLVRDEVILERPIETILSGPAASIIGAKYLSKSEDGIVVDMGGTTTDIALVKDGYPELNDTGAVVEGWVTSIESIKFRTAGLGGDSEISLDWEGKIQVGPRRVIPYSVAASQAEGILSELDRLARREIGINEGQFLLLDRVVEDIDYTEQEEVLIEFLKADPKSLLQIKESLNLVSLKFLKLERLERLEIIKRIGLTPTDILHLLGQYNKWNVKAAELGYELLLNDFAQVEEGFASKLKQMIIKKGAREIAIQLISDQYERYDEEKCQLCEQLLDDSLENEFGSFSWSLKPKAPIITIGAPAEAYLQQVNDYLDAEVILPQNYEVANAIGAAVANIWVKEEVLIKPNAMKGTYVLHSSQGKEEFVELEQAIEYAKNNGRELAVIKAKDAGAKKLEVNLDVKEKQVGLGAKFGGVLLEVRVNISVIGYAL